MNQIRKVVQSRIDNIIKLSKLAGEVEHGPTIGALREGYLIEFFTKLVPSSVSLTSGFITDSSGKISPQLDLVITQKSSLPLIEMKEELSIIPVESALLVAEIKSTLDLKALKQVELQNETISLMNVSGDIGINKFIVPTIILAYDSKIKRETLIKWMEDNGNTIACCILKKETYIRDKSIKVFENTHNEIQHYSVLSFVSTFFNMLEELTNMRDFKPNLNIYLTGKILDNKKG